MSFNVNFNQPKYATCNSAHPPMPQEPLEGLSLIPTTRLEVSPMEHLSGPQHYLKGPILSQTKDHSTEVIQSNLQQASSKEPHSGEPPTCPTKPHLRAATR